MFQTKFAEKFKTHTACSITFFYRAAYEMVWKNTVECDRPQLTIWRMRIACWLTKATYTYAQYQYIETNVMHSLFSLLRIKGLYMFRALLAHLQDPGAAN
jgi:hypothetical protein